MAVVGQQPSGRFTQHIWEKLETEIPAYIVPSPSPSCRGFSDPFFPGEKHHCPSTLKQVEGPCSSSLVTSSPPVFGRRMVAAGVPGPSHTAHALHSGLFPSSSSPAWYSCPPFSVPRTSCGSPVSATHCSGEYEAGWNLLPTGYTDLSLSLTRAMVEGN